MSWKMENGNSFFGENIKNRATEREAEGDVSDPNS